MEVEYVLLPSDLIAFHEFHLKRRPASWKPLAVFLGIYGAMFAFFVAGNGGITRDVVIAGISFLIIGLGICLQIKTQYRSTLKRMRRGVNKGLYAENLGWRRLSLSPTGLKAQTETSTAQILWEVVREIATTAEHAFFYTGRDYGFILPKAAFRDREHFEEYVEKARDYAARSRSGTRTTTPASEDSRPATDIKPAASPRRRG
ncbi:MAG TPA: YcxB family protein [Gemmataceae bacterium]|nr:YcxB family protein [Gemmataceae bacterium]